MFQSWLLRNDALIPIVKGKVMVVLFLAEFEASWSSQGRIEIEKKNRTEICFAHYLILYNNHILPLYTFPTL